VLGGSCSNMYGCGPTIRDENFELLLFGRAHRRALAPAATGAEPKPFLEDPEPNSPLVEGLVMFDGFAC
jgi:hypothetical protein